MSLFSSRMVMTGTMKVSGIGLMGGGAYNFPATMGDVLAFVRTADSGGGGGGGGGGAVVTAGSNAVEGAAALLRAVDAKLDRAVDRLAKQANSSAGAVHVVTTGGGGSSSYSPQSTFSATTVVLALVAAGTVAAVVLWRGSM